MDTYFEPHAFDTMLGGLSVLDVPRLNVQNLDQAKEFIRAYGFDLDNEEDQSKLWSYHRRAVTFIRTDLLLEDELLPDTLSDPAQLRELSYLLIYASAQDHRKDSLQRWSCAILRVIHVLVHLDNDLFTKFSSEIQDQILKPFQSYVSQDPSIGIVLAESKDPERLPLKKFDIKPFKTSKSSIIKLLAKPEAVAFSLLDKIGVRFVTKHMVDVFRVIRFLLRHHLISFPNVIPDQSNNTLYPINLFTEVMASIAPELKLEPHEVDKLLQEKLEEAKDRAQYHEKLNTFSSKDYQFVKFIARRLVKVNLGDQDLSFFYPFEVQIVDYETYLKNLTGPSSHAEYKKRQKTRARLRVFGPEDSTGS